MLFTLLGEAIVAGEQIKEKTAVKLTYGNEVKIQASDKFAQVLFVSSKMLDEPVAWGGPIVMNTKEELNQAFSDLDQGIFLKEEIDY